MMESFMSKGLRKGAWTEEEDNLLRKCIFNFGEGRWHQVPMRAGLNRCRKSCRLRWLNYLKPNIKRGEFKEDEVDLILKLHKLLGNRWSLIAGRLPGRTANDIKNYWNTHLNKKKQNQKRKNKIKILIGSNVDPVFGDKVKGSIDSSKADVVKTTVFKPRPRTFSKTSIWVWNENDINNINMNNQYTCSEIQNQLSSMGKDLHESDKWWESLLFDKDDGHEKYVYNNWWESLLFDKEEEHDIGKRDVQFRL